MKLFEKTLSVEKIKHKNDKKPTDDGAEKDINYVEFDISNDDKLKNKNSSPTKNELITLKPFLPAKERFLFSQRKVDFLQDFCPNITDVLTAQEEHAKLIVEIKPPNVAESQVTKTTDSKGDRRKSSTNSGTTSYSAVANSATYGAAHTSQYQQYGSRYNQHSPSGYNNQYSNYYGQNSAGYGSQAGSTGGSYGRSY